MKSDPRQTYRSRNTRSNEWSITAWPTDNFVRSAATLRQVREEASQLLVPGMTLGMDSETVPPGGRASLVAFTFGPEHRPLPFEDVLDWLRGHPWVRVIEIEHYLSASVNSRDDG